MNFIAGAITELISNLVPNDKRFYLTKGWVTSELIPTLKAMNQRAVELKGITINNQRVQSNTIIACIILGSTILVISILVITCFKTQNNMFNRLQNVVHNLMNSVGLRAPNPMPDFRV